MRMPIFLQLLALLALSGSQFARSAEVCWECPLAKRGGATVTVADVQAKLAPLGERERGAILNDGKQLEMMIDNLLLNRQLTAKAEAEVDDSDPVLAAQLRQARETVLAVVQLNRVRAERLPGDFEQLAREHYATTRATLLRPRGIKVRHLLIGTANRSTDEAAALATSLAAELKGAPDERFAARVMELSDDPGTTSNGGIYELEENDGRFDPVFTAGALGLKQIGELSAPVKTQFGYHLIRLLEERPGGQMSFEEARPMLLERVTTDMRRRVVSEYRNELSQDGDLEIFPENLVHLRVED